MELHLTEHPTHTFGSAQPYNTGLMLFGPAAEPVCEQTIVITGTPRGGTTMIAECFARLGLPIGVTAPAPFDQFNYEDLEFQDILHTEDPTRVNVPRLQELVQRRNASYQKWGFKLPLALNSLPLLERELRNPRFVLVFRDPVAVSSREVIATGLDGIDGLRRALRWQQQMVEFVPQSAAPNLLISYEKALQFPNLVLHTLIQWTGLSPSDEEREDARQCIQANHSEYLNGVSYQRHVFGIPQPPKIRVEDLGREAELLQP